MTTVVKTSGIVLNWNGNPVGEVTNIGGLSSPTNKIPIGSFADTVMKYRPGRRKAGDCTFDVNFNPDNTVQAALETDRQAGTERAVTIVFPSGSVNTIGFSAKVMNYTYSAEDDNIWKAQITLKITTKPQRS